MHNENQVQRNQSRRGRNHWTERGGQIEYSPSCDSLNFQKVGDFHNAIQDAMESAFREDVGREVINALKQRSFE
jgi:hypothetical protein